MTPLRVRLHICPLLVGEAQKVVTGLGRADVELLALEGGADAEACRPTVRASGSVVDVIVGGPCARTDVPVGFRSGPPLLSCYDALVPGEEVAEWMREGVHLLVPSQLGPGGLPLERWGFTDEGAALDYLRDGLASLVLLDTGLDPAAPGRARALAADLGRPLTVRPVPLSRLELVLRLAIAEATALALVPAWRRRLAEHQLLLELLNQLHHAVDFDSSMSSVLRTLEGLFGGGVRLVEQRDGGPGERWSTGRAAIRSDDGFIIPLGIAQQFQGELHVERLSVPERMDDYLALALTFAPLLARALADRARQQREAGFRRLSHTVFEGTYEGLVVTDPDGTIISVNPAFCAISGYSSEELVGQNPRMLKSGRHDGAFYAGLWGSLLATGRWQGEVFNRRKDGTEYRQRLSIGAVRDAEGRALYYVGAAQDITKEYTTREALSHQASHDSLTDLGNRVWLHDRLKSALSRADQRGTWVGVCFVDLDRFKQVNDSHGHDAGDALLKEVAQRLDGAVRRNDGVARVGGDEFVIVVEDLSDPAHAKVVAETVWAALQAPFEWNGVNIMVTASVGLVLYPDEATGVDALLTAADDAMYRAKAQGRNRVQLHDPQASAAQRRQDRLRELLRLRLTAAEMQVAFQPIVRIGDGMPVGAEALARLSDDDGEPVPPSLFVPIAEQDGQISELGAEIAAKALQALATWPANAAGDPLYVSINVAAAQLHGSLTAEGLAHACVEAGVDPEQVVLEVVERTVIDSETVRRRALSKLQSTGARVALDDFGTGYSALSYLVDLDASIVKLDRSFVIRLPHDARVAAMVRGLVGLLLHLGLTIVAEGIETEEQRAFLEDAGCQLGQGYLWSKPLGPADFLGWLAAQAPGAEPPAG